MATMNVSLPEQMKSWVEQQSEGGRFSNSSDYVRDLIRRDQERGVRIAELQAAIDAGLNSGPAKTFDPAVFKRKMHQARDQ
ncbi:antitoxin ParD1/3/4 [Octadecabacter temperatus]|uniref:Antitoxin ParD4 n=1 Tax=Octadecabacter temperatus TaxID=1458307 RepID=A0A0K0YA85_9RHOB|nr:type II toxin-antitoxin system ParD family antitoxin [Octadecabacter temperatus]AKS47831.1 Antitoxin ParD4 [Octadecabacter temperatus]SIO48394.1 antitoxin ParD1/3/4 [Octadecabacter temperatus]